MRGLRLPARDKALPTPWPQPRSRRIRPRRALHERAPRGPSHPQHDEEGHPQARHPTQGAGRNNAKRPGASWRGRGVRRKGPRHRGGAPARRSTPQRAHGHRGCGISRHKGAVQRPCLHGRSSCPDQARSGHARKENDARLFSATGFSARSRIWRCGTAGQEGVPESEVVAQSPCHNLDFGNAFLQNPR